MFEVFNQVHLSFLAIASVLTVVTIAINKFSDSNVSLIYGKLIGLLLIGHQVYFHWMHLVVLHTYTLQKCLPFHLCSLSIFVVGIALLSGSQKIINAALVWCPAAGLLGLLFPSLGKIPWNSFATLEFFWSHILIIVGVVHLSLQENFNLNLKALPVYCFTLIAFSLAFVYPLDALIGANYMFLIKLAEPGPMTMLPTPPFQIPVFVVLLLILSTIQYFLYVSIRKVLNIGNSVEMT